MRVESWRDWRPGALRSRLSPLESRLNLSRRAVLAALTLSLIPACRESPLPEKESGHIPAASRAEAAGYAFTPAERRAIDLFLGRHRHLRVAQDSDRREEDEPEVRDLYGVYHPYFVRGDVNDDGILDFVLAFVRRGPDGETPWFTVVVFPGRDRPGGGTDFEGGTFLEKDISLSDGDLAIDRDAILITPDLAEETTRRYRWDPTRRSYIFLREGEAEPQPAPLAQT